METSNFNISEELIKVYRELDTEVDLGRTKLKLDVLLNLQTVMADEKKRKENEVFLSTYGFKSGVL